MSFLYSILLYIYSILLLYYIILYLIILYLYIIFIYLLAVFLLRYLQRRVKWLLESISGHQLKFYCFQHSAYAADILIKKNFLHNLWIAHPFPRHFTIAGKAKKSIVHTTIIYQPSAGLSQMKSHFPQQTQIAMLQKL